MKKIFNKLGLALGAMMILSTVAIGTLSEPAAAAAAGVADSSRTKVCDGVNLVLGVDDCEEASETTITSNVWKIAADVVTWIMWGVGIICVIFIIIGGIRYATSGGDADKVKSAKNTLLYAIIGLAIALLAGTIVTIVSGFTAGSFDLNTQRQD